MELSIARKQDSVTPWQCNCQGVFISGFCILLLLLN